MANYLYNGVELPAFPNMNSYDPKDIDTNYAVITCYYAGGCGWVHRLLCCSAPITKFYFNSENTQAYRLKSTSWEYYYIRLEAFMREAAWCIPGVNLNPGMFWPAPYQPDKDHVEGNKNGIISLSENEYIVWANHDIIDEDTNTIFMRGTAPVDVETGEEIPGILIELPPEQPKLEPLDPQSLTAGWLVGKKIAAMRGKV